MKDEALKLALDALDNLLYWDNGKSDYDQAREAITAIKQALAAPVQDSTCRNALREQGKAYPRTCKKCGKGHCIELANSALDKKAENARELGLDYEPVWCGHCNGSGRMVRDPDIGTDQECFVCDGTGVSDDTTPPAQPAPVQEPVAMRMPKVGDKVVCIEDESLGTVVYLTAGGSPEIKFDDGSHGTYMLREFAELFGYTTPPAAQRQWVGLTDEERGKVYADWRWIDGRTSNLALCEAIEAKLKELNT
jgi:hypothetical protein